MNLIRFIISCAGAISSFLLFQWCVEVANTKASGLAVYENLPDYVIRVAILSFALSFLAMCIKRCIPAIAVGISLWYSQRAQAVASDLVD